MDRRRKPKGKDHQLRAPPAIRGYFGLVRRDLRFELFLKIRRIDPCRGLETGELIVRLRLEIIQDCREERIQRRSADLAKDGKEEAHRLSLSSRL